MGAKSILTTATDGSSYTRASLQQKQTGAKSILITATDGSKEHPYNNRWEQLYQGNKGILTTGTYGSSYTRASLLPTPTDGAATPGHPYYKNRWKLLR